MRAIRFRSLIGTSAVLAVVAGCGVDIDIDGNTVVTAGATTAYSVKMTNASACPLRELSDPVDFVFLPMLPAATIENNEFLSLLCGLSPLPPPAMSTALAANGDVPWDDLRAALHDAAAAAASAQCSGMGVICETVTEPPVEVVICDTGPLLAPGDMRSLSCTATVPSGSGPFFTLAVSAMIADGVCLLGTAEAGDACDENSDCGMGGTCGTGICVGGTNAGNGCNSIGDCPGMGATCEDCNADAGLGFACLEQASGAAPAPALAPWGLGAALLGLAAVAYRRFR